MKMSELQNKDIINLIDGKQMGKIIDIIVTESGKIEKLVVEKRKFFLSLFTNKNEIEIKWEQINKIGEDVILVNIVI